MLKISIVTPTFNSAKSISDNVKSILNQTYQNFEHIIIDNLSSDETLMKIEEAYIKIEKTDKLSIYSEKDNGISDAFNKGILKASGDIIAILNSDDFYYSNSIFEKIETIFRKNPEVDFVHGDMLFVDNLFGTNIRKPLQCSLQYAMPFNHPTMFFRKQTYDDLGLFNVLYRYCMDFDFVCRIVANGKKGYYLPETITVMNSGGASDLNEYKVLEEFKIILMKNNLFDELARKYYQEKKLRIKTKQFLNKLNLNFLIQAWRHIKWKNKKE